MKIMKAPDRWTFFCYIVLASLKLRTEVIITANECRKMFTPSPFNNSSSSRSEDKKVHQLDKTLFSFVLEITQKVAGKNLIEIQRYRRDDMNIMSINWGCCFPRFSLEPYSRNRKWGAQALSTWLVMKKKWKCGTKAWVDNGEWQPVSEKGESIVLIKIQN